MQLVHRRVADWAKSSGAKQFLFISSAGIYKLGDELPHVEGVCNYSHFRSYSYEENLCWTKI